MKKLTINSVIKILLKEEKEKFKHYGSVNYYLNYIGHFIVPYYVEKIAEQDKIENKSKMRDIYKEIILGLKGGTKIKELQSN